MGQPSAETFERNSEHKGAAIIPDLIRQSTHRRHHHEHYYY
jgi:hypothetical protein